VYEEMIERWFAEKVEPNRLETMLKALEDGNVKLFEQILREVVLQIMSYHDFSGAPEKVYHALVTGMLVWMSGKYEIRSNRESGYGRYDLMLKPKDTSKQGIIIEFKKVYEDDSPEDVLEEALNQIEDKKYVAELEGSGIKNILKIAVVFRGKELWVKNG
ncbi:MAG: AAA family ATPase, partial [Desulfobacterales bacterium]|nr:AAA family ATPase [Desulfobacterales bacterium]